MNSKLILTQDEKVAFVDGFLDNFLSYGFGTLPKSEIDILIFHLLYHKTSALDNLSNYELANLLRISERKIKSLKENSNLKYQQIAHKEALLKIAKLFCDEKSVKTVVDGEFLQFSMEDPVLKREFEHAVKELGYFVDYSFNREIIKVDVKTFLNIFLNNFKDANEEIAAKLNETIEEEGIEVLEKEKELPLSRKIDLVIGQHSNIIGLVVDILKTVFGGLLMK